MNCEFNILLSRYHDHELTEQRYSQVQAHLNSCPSCAAELEQMQAVSRSLREGAREFDFLRNPEPYKYRWGARDHINYRVTFRRGNRTTPGPDPPSPD